MTTQTSLLRLILPVQGEFSGTWGDQVNAGLTNLLDTAIAGTTTLNTDADVTLTTANFAADQARAMILFCTGTRTAIRNINAPLLSKVYVVINTTSFGVVLRGTTPTTGVTIPATSAAICAWNGSDFIVVAQNNVGSNFTGVLPVANGGTGASTLTANNVLLGNGGSAVQVVAPGTSGNLLTSNGTTWTSATPAAGPIPAGTVMLFYQAAAPTGWTQVTTQNNKALRVVSGAGGGTGGTVAFTTAFTSQTPAGTVGNTTLSTTQIPSHTHTYPVYYAPGGGAPQGSGTSTNANTGATGGGGAHNHTFTGTAIDLTVQYIDILLASKN